MTIAPDQGMRHLYPAAGPAPAAAVPAPAAAPGAELDIGARLVIALDSVTAAAQRMAAASARTRIPWEECHVVPIVPNVTNAALLIDDPDRWGPRQGWAWLITRLTLVMSAGATATAYRDAATSGNELLYSITAGVWEPKSMVLLPGQRLVVAASAQAVVNGDAIEMPVAVLPAFLL